MKVKLTKEEFEYLISSKFLPGDLLEVLSKSHAVQGSTYVVEFSAKEADMVRDLCGERLQLKGFDRNYNPTREGLILESLIDKFLVG